MSGTSYPNAKMITKKNVSATTAANGGELRLKIEKRAYELWQADGAPHGNDLHYWFEAERDLTSRHGTQAKLAKPGSNYDNEDRKSIRQISVHG